MLLKPPNRKAYFVLKILRHHENCSYTIIKDVTKSYTLDYACKHWQSSGLPTVTRVGGNEGE